MADVLLQRPLPHNLDAERAVLGAILLDNQAFTAAVQLLRPDDFFLGGHRRIFARMIQLAETNRAIDLVTLNEELTGAGELEAAGGVAYLGTLVDGVPRITNVKYYTRIVKEKALLRRLIRMADGVMRATLEGKERMEDLLRRVKGEVENLSAQATVEVWAERKVFRTGAELAAEGLSKVEWIARPWVAGGAITEIAGKVKVAGKTTFVTHLARAVLDGRPFMSEPTTKTPVLYLTEQPPSSFRVAMERADLLSRDDFVVLRWRDTVGLSWEVVANMAVEECRKRGAKLLVVDTLPQFAGLVGDAENNAGDALLAMQPLQKAAAEGLGIVVVRHERKSGGTVGDAGRGSSAYGGAVDIVLSLRRREGKTQPTVRLIQAISRFDETPDELVVELMGASYVALGRAADVAAREAEKLILEAAPHCEAEAATFGELIEGTDVKRSTAQRAIKNLVSAGGLRRTGSGRKGKPFRYFVPEIVSAQTPTLNGRKQNEG